MPCRQMVRSSPIMFLLDRSYYYFVFTKYFFFKPLYNFHVEKSWINNNEASKQNLSQQWIADRLLNYSFSFNTPTEIILLLPNVYECKEKVGSTITNEASKQNLSQQWIADRLLNHNSSSILVWLTPTHKIEWVHWSENILLIGWRLLAFLTILAKFKPCRWPTTIDRIDAF